ncbi:hypothetical protein ACFSSC_02395 [Corynebacterium mendelii]|uniref:Serine hydrolase n=2 Tax=Corynebacterium mendelii TaxID=2765362 RepID=A0A939E1L3_9CORY|nr:hypothetical protein [Corynebacterium mendelii]MBN9644133.1 hypothetical protein [Corynebacterium mendelii]
MIQSASPTPGRLRAGLVVLAGVVAAAGSAACTGPDDGAVPVTVTRTSPAGPTAAAAGTTGPATTRPTAGAARPAGDELLASRAAQGLAPDGLPVVQEPGQATARPAAADLAAAARAVAATAPGSLGVGLADGSGVAAAGDGRAWPAWSTSKIPVAVAALRDNPQLAPAMRAAVRVSDNAAAAQLWYSLGDAGRAAAAATAVLRQGGDMHTVVPESTTTGFSVFGQTPWTAADQALFAFHLPCLAGSAPVVAAMGEITPEQAYGLGRIPGARFKGGWGPDPAGYYTVRQMGVVAAGDGVIGVSLVARPPDGTYATGQMMLDRAAGELTGQLAASGYAARGRCS